MNYKKYKSRILFGIATLAWSIFHCGAIAQQPNFIIYLADDQDMLDYGCYGNANVHTPSVDRLAAGGMKFNKAYTAQAICSPSRSQLFTGKYPLKNGCFVNHSKIFHETKAISHYLGNLGYTVVLAGKSHVAPETEFDWDLHIPDQKKRGNELHERVPLSEIAKFLDTISTPFCLIVGSHFPHGPYPEITSYSLKDILIHPYMKQDANRMGYYENIKTDDFYLSETIRLLEGEKLDESVFVYLSDHGISGKFTVKEPGLRIPLVIRWPDMIQKGISSEALVHITDILPTFIDIAGGDVPSDMDGKSLLPLFSTEQTKHHSYVYGVSHKQNTQYPYIFPSRMIRGERYKYIINSNALEVYESNLGTDDAVNLFIERGARKYSAIPYEELYDLEQDPWEKNNLASNSDYDEVKSELRKQLLKWMEDQNDFILEHPAPVLWANQHFLDKASRFNIIPEELESSLKSSPPYLHKKEVVE
jgi:uncharacterized sulfatase